MIEILNQINWTVGFFFRTLQISFGSLTISQTVPKHCMETHLLWSPRHYRRLACDWSRLSVQLETGNGDTESVISEASMVRSVGKTFEQAIYSCTLVPAQSTVPFFCKPDNQII